MFLETSALTGENVEETFLKCARSILTKIESGTATQCYTVLLLHFITCAQKKYSLNLNSTVQAHNKFV